MDVQIPNLNQPLWQPGSQASNLGLEAVMMGCMDRKLTFKRRHPIRKKYNVMFPDLLTHGGGPYRICNPNAFGGHVSDRRVELWKAQCITCEYDINEVAVGAHGISRIILATHQQCGMMRIDGNCFPEVLSEEEKNFHQRVHEIAGNWVADNCPGIKEIITCFEYYEFVEQGKKHLVHVDELSIAA